MKLFQAIELLRAHKSVRRANWPDGVRLFLPDEAEGTGKPVAVLARCRLARPTGLDLFLPTQVDVHADDWQAA